MKKLLKTKEKMQKNKKQKGITLIALVITIVVLIILAGISINLILGENGLFRIAKKAVENMQLAQEQEQTSIEDLEGKIDFIVNSKEPKIIENTDKKFEENTTLYDEYNNKITVPQNFKIVSSNKDNTIEYTYSGNGNPTVQDGIVIEDDDGNQFVWVPVGKINNKDSTTTEITLARRVFGEDGSVIEESKDGNKILEENYKEETASEHTTSGENNTIAEDIDEFKKSVEKNGGYYIARYEASYKDANTPYSKQSKGTTIGSSSESDSYSENQLWNFITQQDAAKVAKNMYKDNTNYTSDLVNSYAWDTAVYFIQQYSKNKTYSRQTSLNYEENKDRPDNTGEREETTDKVCNIYDMASNCTEWTTETSTKTESDGDKPCVRRGDRFAGNHYFTSSRSSYLITAKSGNISFRVTMYIN